MNSFYAGMMMAALLLLNMVTKFSVLVSAVACPFFTATMYIALRLVAAIPSGWKLGTADFDGVLAAVFGSLWVILLTSI